MTKKDQCSEINSYGIRQPMVRRYHRLVWVTLVSLLAAVVLVIGYYWELPSPGQAATAIVAMAALLLGFQQWQESRHEASLDKLYERAQLSNERFIEWSEARAIVSHFWKDDSDASFRKGMYVYIELDNLEYIIEKYKLGFIRTETALRGLRTFKTRCRSKEFRDLALHQVHEGGLQQDYSDRG